MSLPIEIRPLINYSTFALPFVSNTPHRSRAYFKALRPKKVPFGRLPQRRAAAAIPRLRCAARLCILEQ